MEVNVGILQVYNIGAVCDGYDYMLFFWGLLY